MTDPRRDPERWKQAFEAATKEYGLPRGLLEKVAEVESNFNPDARSRAGAVGLMQIIPRWHPDVDPTDPIASINYAGRYLSELKDRFGSWDLALAAYNAGPTNVRRFGGIPPFPETQNYVRRISQAVPFEPEEREVSGLAAQIASRVVDPTQGRMMPDATRVSLAEQVEGRQGEEERQTFLNYVTNTVGRQMQETMGAMRGTELDQQIMDAGASSFERFTDPARRDNLPGPLAALMEFAESPAAVAVGMTGPFAAGKVTRAASPFMASKGAQATPTIPFPPATTTSPAPGIIPGGLLSQQPNVDPAKHNVISLTSSGPEFSVPYHAQSDALNYVKTKMKLSGTDPGAVLVNTHPSSGEIQFHQKVLPLVADPVTAKKTFDAKYVLDTLNKAGVAPNTFVDMKLYDLNGDLLLSYAINTSKATNGGLVNAPLANQVTSKLGTTGSVTQVNTVGPVVVPDVPDIMASAQARGVALQVSSDAATTVNTLKAAPNPKFFPDNAPQVIKAQKAGYEVQSFHGTEFHKPFELTDDIWFGTHFGTPRSAIERIHAKSFGENVLGELKLMENGRELTYRVGNNSRVLPVMLRGNEKNYLNMTDDGANTIRRMITDSENANHITSSQARDLIDRYDIGVDPPEIIEALGKLLEPKGIYGVRYINGLEDPGSISYLTFLPGSVRSLNANFAPAKAGEPGLMLGIGALGAGLGASLFESSSFSDLVNKPDG